MGDGNYITDCSSKENTTEAGLLLMLQRWAQLSFSSLVVPNLRSLVFYPSAYRVQNRLKARPGRGVRKREPRKGSCHRVHLHSSGYENSQPTCLTPGRCHPLRDSLVTLPTGIRKLSRSKLSATWNCHHEGNEHLTEAHWPSWNL